MHLSCPLRLRLAAPAVARSAAGFATAALLALAAAPAAAEVEFSLYGGIQGALPSDVKDSTLGTQEVDWEGKSFSPPPHYGLRATWWRDAKWGFGVEFNHAKVYADNPAAYGYDRLELTDGMNLVTLNVFRRWQDDARRWTPYVGVGAGVAVPHVDVQPAGQAHTFGYQLTGPAVQLVAGTSYALNDRWSLFGEYKGSWSSHKADLDSGGTLETDIVTNALNLGVSLKF